MQTDSSASLSSVLWYKDTESLMLSLPDLGFLCVCMCVLMRGACTKSEEKCASANPCFCPSLAQSVCLGQPWGSRSLGCSPREGECLGRRQGLLLAGAAKDSCAVSEPLTQLCAVSGSGARQPHYLVAGSAGRWGS